MDQSRRKVAGRIDGIAGRASKGHSYGHDEHGHRKWGDARKAFIPFGREHQDGENEKPGTQNLTEKIADLVSFEGRQCRRMPAFL